MRRRCCVAQAGLAALGAMVFLLVLPGTSAAGGEPRGRGTEISTGDVLLARGAGYADPSTSPKVRTMQRALWKLGWQPGPVDGLFGPRTEAAVMRIQRATALAPDGIFGPRTARALETAMRKPLRQGMGYQEPDGSPRVRTLQARLRGLGLDPGPVDGVFGPRTQAGVKRLQRAGGVSADGIVGSDTRRLLADGSSALGKELARTQPAARHDRRRHGEGTKARSDSRGDVRIRRSGGSESSVATEDAAQASGRIDVPLLVAAVVLALVLAVVIGVLLWRLGPVLGGVSVPLKQGVMAEGCSRLRSIVRFRGRLHALVSGRGRLGRLWEPGYLMSDRARPNPFWTGQEEVGSLVAAPAQAERDATSARAPLPPPPWASEKPPMDRVRALGYVSVPDGDSLRGPRLKAQMQAINSLCDRRGWTLLEVVRDYEEPRGKALERPGLGYALERVERGEASCVVVSQLQRLGRSVADLGRTLETIGRSRGRLVALDVGIDTAAPEGLKAASVLVAVSAWERNRMVERTRKGLEATRTGGGPVSRPSVHDMPALKEWIAELRESGLTLQAIADRLNAEGVPTLRGGAKWRPSSVQTAAGYRRPQSAPARDAGGRSANGGEGRMS
jgi:peptidoglycan hydrolase-like protein with peptidoglycan-binding domain/DNA invertase Pin-like site-specific DNA recombinase